VSFDLLPLHIRDRDEIVRLFTRYPFKVLQRRTQGIDSYRLAQLLWDLAEPQFGQPRTSAWVAWRRRPREAIGLVLMRPHVWHSQVFGRSMGRIGHLINYVEPTTVGPALLEAVGADARAAGIEQLTCRVDGQDWPNLHLLESQGFRCVDCSLKLAHRLDDFPAAVAEDAPDGIEVRPFDLPDLDALQQIAARSHAHNHFYNDPQLARDRVSALFQEWVHHCAQGAAAFILVAADADSRIVGFVTVLSNTALARVVGVSVGIIDYIVVDRDHAGRGIGRALLRAALRSLAREHQWVELRASEDNYRAVAFYSAAGFQIIGSDFVLHRWEAAGK
jgi:ribosomal protein S18 acetylase RimI-like enzyme